MDFDVQQLSAEIRRIDAEYRQANDRLHEVSGRGRGRGRYRGRGRGRVSQRQPLRRFNSYETSAPSEPLAEDIVEEPRVASSIVEVHRDEIKRDFIPPVILKRPENRPVDEDPKMKDRNRRIFSSLLGTLEKFREENDTVEKSERWRKREEIAKRAIEKTTAESQRLREKEKKDREEQKLQETEKLKELDSIRKRKNLELIYAKRVQHQQLLLNFISTSVSPIILWLPAKHNSETQSLLDAKKEEYENWLVEQKEHFEKEKVKMETGEGVGDETVSDCRHKIEISTQQQTEQSALQKEDILNPESEEMQFQPVSEMNVLPIEEETNNTHQPTSEPDHSASPPPAKKSKLNSEEEAD